MAQISAGRVERPSKARALQIDPKKQHAGKDQRGEWKETKKERIVRFVDVRGHRPLRLGHDQDVQPLDDEHHRIARKQHGNAEICRDQAVKQRNGHAGEHRQHPADPERRAEGLRQHDRNDIAQRYLRTNGKVDHTAHHQQALRHRDEDQRGVFCDDRIDVVDIEEFLGRLDDDVERKNEQEDHQTGKIGCGFQPQQALFHCLSPSFIPIMARTRFSSVRRSPVKTSTALPS